MFQRNQIEKLLKLNGVKLDSPDDEIKSILISAQWHDDDVEAAILVLRENKNNHNTHVDSLHKVFRTDDRLPPEAISSLLGIEMNVTSADIKLRHTRARGGVTPSQVMIVGGFSLVLSFVFIFAAMWYLKIGFFSPDSYLVYEEIGNFCYYCCGSNRD